MLKLGQDNQLKIMRETSVGLFLSDEEGNEVLLPNKYVYEDFKVGDLVDVFVYRDSNERLISTTLIPKIKLNQFAYLRAKQKTQFGMFMDWGLEKDLLIPFRQQGSDMEVGKWYVVHLYLDEETDRLVGSTRVNQFIKEDIDLAENQEVEILLTGKTDLGWNAIINHRYRGLVYYNEIFEELKAGDTRIAFVKKVREDGKVDLSLRKLGYSGIEPMAVKIIDTLMQYQGFIPINDKSEPEDINTMFGISKKSFKKAIGSLYKQHIIRIEDDGIYLNDED